MPHRSLKFMKSKTEQDIEALTVELAKASDWETKLRRFARRETAGTNKDEALKMADDFGLICDKLGTNLERLREKRLAEIEEERKQREWRLRPAIKFLGIEVVDGGRKEIAAA